MSARQEGAFAIFQRLGVRELADDIIRYKEELELEQWARNMVLVRRVFRQFSLNRWLNVQARRAQSTALKRRRLR